MTDLRWCHWHQGMADNVVLINAIETGSGPGGMLYACPPCRTMHSLRPLAGQPADCDGSLSRRSP